MRAWYALVVVGDRSGRVFRSTLAKLRQAAVIQSTESSNRIEGVTAPHDRIVKLVQKKVKPGNRSEQEIAGYRDVLNTIRSGNFSRSESEVIIDLGTRTRTLRRHAGRAGGPPQ